MCIACVGAGINRTTACELFLFLSYGYSCQVLALSRFCHGPTNPSHTHTHTPPANRRDRRGNVEEGQDDPIPFTNTRTHPAGLLKTSGSDFPPLHFGLSGKPPRGATRDAHLVFFSLDLAVFLPRLGFSLGCLVQIRKSCRCHGTRYHSPFPRAHGHLASLAFLSLRYTHHPPPPHSFLSHVLRRPQ